MVIDNEYVTLLFHPEAGVVHHEFHRHVRGEDLRRTLMAGCELLRQNAATKWLSDDRRTAAPSPDDSQWIASVWYPLAVSAGWRHWAVVKPETLPGQLNLRQWLERYAGLGLNVRAFDDPAGAMEWLEAQ